MVTLSRCLDVARVTSSCANVLTTLVQYENPQTGESSREPGFSANDTRGQPKKPRIVGGRAAVPKRIVADYDSDDGRIINLKQQGYTDEYISQKLIQEGRIRYVPKTVGSRWLRLRKTLEDAEEEKLDDEMSDWHVDEVMLSISTSGMLPD